MTEDKSMNLSDFCVLPVSHGQTQYYKAYRIPLWDLLLPGWSMCHLLQSSCDELHVNPWTIKHWAQVLHRSGKEGLRTFRISVGAGTAETVSSGELLCLFSA